MSLDRRLRALEAQAPGPRRCPACRGYRIGVVAELEPFAQLGERLGYWPATCICADAPVLSAIAVEYAQALRTVRSDGLVNLEPPTRCLARALGLDEDAAVAEMTAICRAHGWLVETEE